MGGATPLQMQYPLSGVVRHKEGKALPCPPLLPWTESLMYAAAELGTGAIDRTSHRKWRETKQQLI